MSRTLQFMIRALENRKLKKTRYIVFDSWNGDYDNFETKADIKAYMRDDVAKSQRGWYRAFKVEEIEIKDVL